MKTINYREYNDLFDSEKESALNIFLQQGLQMASEYPYLYQYDEKLHKKILKAHKKAEKNQTPWFAHEYIMEDCADELREIALDEAQDVLYEPCDQSFTIISYYDLEKAGK